MVTAEAPPAAPKAEAAYGERPDDAQIAVDRRYLDLRSHLLDVDGLRNIPAPRPLVKGYLFLDSLAWIGGKPGHGKSFLAVELACCVGTGTPWHGEDVTKGKVLYCIAEGASGLSQRVDAWSLSQGVKVTDVTFLPVPVQMMTDIDVTAFTQLLGDLDPSMVILDTQARVTVGAEENSSRDMGIYVDALEAIRRATGACVVSVHHEPRNGENLRGSTALEGAATSIVRVAKDGNLIVVSNSKQKDTPEQLDLTLALKQVGDSAVLSYDGSVSGMTESEALILTTLRGFGVAGARKTELNEACGLPKTTWYRSINALVNKDLVLTSKEGNSLVYTLSGDDMQESL